MLCGLNYPWMNYGWDFGVPPPGWRATVSWHDEIREQLPHWRELGIGVVRWFILADGLALGADRMPQLTTAFLDDLECMLGCFTPEVQVLPVLLDFPVALPEPEPKSGPHRLPHGYKKGGRASLFRDPSVTQQFMARVLRPLLEVSRGYRQNVFAWEVINEPEWVVRGRALGRTWGTLPERAKIHPSRMREFFREALLNIEGEGFRSTIGFSRASSAYAWLREMSSFLEDVPGFLPQHHHYPAAEDPLEVANGPTILGEFGTHRTEAPWPELGADGQTVAGRLALAAERGYEVAMPWSYRARDAASGSWDAIAQGLAEFRDAQ